MEHTFIATLTGIISVKEGLDSDMADYIIVRSKLDNRLLKDDDTIAIFNISGTTSYQAFFIDRDTTIEQIKSKLEELNSLMNHDSEEMLKEYMKNM